MKQGTTYRHKNSGTHWECGPTDEIGLIRSTVATVLYPVNSDGTPRDRGAKGFAPWTVIDCNQRHFVETA